LCPCAHCWTLISRRIRRQVNKGDKIFEFHGRIEPVTELDDTREA
jgi:hypothetical protein